MKTVVIAQDEFMYIIGVYDSISDALYDLEIVEDIKEINIEALKKGAKVEFDEPRPVRLTMHKVYDYAKRFKEPNDD